MLQNQKQKFLETEQGLNQAQNGLVWMARCPIQNMRWAWLGCKIEPNTPKASLNQAHETQQTKYYFFSKGQQKRVFSSTSHEGLL